MDFLYGIIHVMILSFLYIKSIRLQFIKNNINFNIIFFFNVYCRYIHQCIIRDNDYKELYILWDFIDGIKLKNNNFIF